MSSAEIYLNGELVVKPNQFGQNADTITVQINLASTNLLEVTLASEPGSFITLSISSVLKEFELDANTVALYHLNEGNGTSLLDASNNNNHGSLGGGTWTTDGKFDYGLLLDGVDDYFEIPSPNDLGLQNGYTIELWVKPFKYRAEPCCSNSTYIFSASREQYEFHIFEPGGQGSTRFIPVHRDQVVVPDGGSVEIGGWNCISTTVDAQGVARFYVNGVFQAETSDITIPSDAQPLNFGRRVSGYFGTLHLNGIIDEIRISNIAREPCP